MCAIICLYGCVIRSVGKPNSPEICFGGFMNSKGELTMKITVCIGSSCHIKGSRPVVEQLQDLIAQNGLKGKVDLAGTFCMGKCQTGVSVTIDEEYFSVSPETVNMFFQNEVMTRLK